MDFTQSRHSPGNTSFPIFHHERPIANLPTLTLPDEPMNPRPCINIHTKERRLAWFERRRENSVSPTHHAQAKVFHLHTYIPFIQSHSQSHRHLMVKAWNLACQSSRLIMRKCFHLSRVLIGDSAKLAEMMKSWRKIFMTKQGFDDGIWCTPLEPF